MQAKLAYIYLILILLCLPGVKQSVAQQPSQCLAVITEINGEALLKKAGKSEYAKASWGAQLNEGDQIKTSAGSGVKLLFSNSTLIGLGPNSSISISGKDSPSTSESDNVTKISSAMMVNLSSLTSKRDDKKDVGALAGMRSVNSEQTIELANPNNTLIKTDKPSFSWLAKRPFESYIVNLYNSSGLVWSKKVSANVMIYPENEKGLEFGESYFWYVEGEELINTEKSANHKFSLLSQEMSKEVEEQEKLIRTTFRDEPESSSLHSVLGAYFIDKGLLMDAINEFQIISKINADAPLPHEILGSLYTEVDNKDKAIEELKKALSLSKNNNN